MENKLNYISLKEASKHCEYSQEYLSLRARQGKLKAVKLGRNWSTTKKWLQEYAKKETEPILEEVINPYLKKLVPPRNLPTEDFYNERKKISLSNSFSFVLSLAAFLVLFFPTVFINKNVLFNSFEVFDEVSVNIGAMEDVIIKEGVGSLVSSVQEMRDFANDNFKNISINVSDKISQASLVAVSVPENADKNELGFFKNIFNFGGSLVSNILNSSDNLTGSLQSKFLDFIGSVTGNKVTVFEKTEDGQIIYSETSEKEIVDLKSRVANLETQFSEGVITKEITREVQTTNVTKIEPIKEITKETIVINNGILLQRSIDQLKIDLENQISELKNKSTQAIYYPSVPNIVPSIPYTSISTGDMSLSSSNFLDLSARQVRVTGNLSVSGSITNAAWEGDVIDVLYGGTGLSTIAAGSILAANALDVLSTVTSISGTKYLTNTNGAITWETLNIGDVTDVGDCAGGVCLDGTSDGGTWIKFYDAQGVGQLVTGDLDSAKTWTLPNLTGTVALTANKLSDFASTTSAELASILSDESGTGVVAFTTSPVFTTPNIGAATAESINRDSTDLTISTTTSGNIILSPFSNVGIGTSGPDRKLDVLDVSNPQLRLTQTNESVYTEFQVAATTGDLTIAMSPGDDIILPDQNLWVCEAGSCPSLSLSSDGNVIAESDFYIYGDITLDSGGTIQSTGDANININAGSGTVVIGGGTGKIDAGTVDPVYTIDGKSYATYMAGMTGIKEETTGVMQLKYSSNKKVYTASIDFNNLDKESDLWIFSRIIDKDINLISVLLTPNSPGKVWYEKNAEGRKIIFYSDKSSEISYRLSAPRFDYKEWPNLREDQATKGFIVP